MKIEKYCKICATFFEDNELKEGICSNCQKDLKTLPNTISKSKKLDLIRYIRNNNFHNRYKDLSKKEMDNLYKCEKCEWVRYIDYGHCRVHCGRPECERWE